MTGVQTCALPICFPVTIHTVGDMEGFEEKLYEIKNDYIQDTTAATTISKIILGDMAQEQDKNGNRKNTPAHDWSSHGCDAFRYMAVAFKETVAPKPYKRQNNYGGHGWMG